MYGCYGFPVHLYYHYSSLSPFVAWALFVCLVVDNRGHMWVLLISSLLICLLLLFYWLFFLALFEFGKTLFDIPLSGDIDYIFVLNMLLVYPLPPSPLKKWWDVALFGYSICIYLFSIQTKVSLDWIYAFLEEEKLQEDATIILSWGIINMAISLCIKLGINLSLFEACELNSLIIPNELYMLLLSYY